MIAKLIAYLQWIESSNSPKKWFEYFFSFLFMGISMILVFILLASSSGAFFSPSNTSNGIFYLACFFIAAIVATYVYGIYKRITQKDFSLVRIIMNGVMPLTIGILLMYLHADERKSLEWYIYLFGGLYALSPFSLFISGFESMRNGRISQISKLYRYYINAFLISLAIFLPFFILKEPFREPKYMELYEIVIISIIALCTYVFVTWIVLTYAWDEVKPIDNIAVKNIRKGAVGLAVLFFFIWLSPNWKEIIIEGRIEAAQSQLQKYGETKEGLQKASNVWFLEWALKEKYLNGNLYSGEKELYARLYDTSIESAIDEELDTEKFKARNSNATSMLARGENAKVELNFAKHESEILSDIGAIRTTITYEFQNTSTTNQEVVFSFILPDAESVMTDLKLGLNLEYAGIIAPRGAASKVYQDSLRRNTDPALLEQTGPVSYRLRVFPVLSTSDTKTQGRQRVQLVYVSPQRDDASVTLIPKTNILNLKLTDTSEILTRVTDGAKVLSQDSLQTDDIETLTEGKTETLSEKTEKTYKNFCSANTYPTLDITSFETTEKKLSKNIVFFDISKSVGEKSGIKKRYQSLVDAWKDSGVALDIFTYNFDIYPSGYTLANLDFWGTTDMSKIIDYIEKNALTDANIVIVTDDNSYERASAEIKTIDYKKLKSNKISLIQVGDQVRTLKTEITKAILATEGEMIILDESTPLSEAVKNIFAPEEKVGPCVSYSGASLPSLQALQGYEDSKKVFGESTTNTGIVKKIKNYDAYQRYGSMKPSLKAIGEMLDFAYVSDSLLVTGSILEGSGYVSIQYAEFCPGYCEEGQERVLKLDDLNQTIYWQLWKGRELKQEVSKKYSESDIQSLWEEIFYTTSLETITKTDAMMQEEIAKTSRIVNQAVSLIAVENDQQRADLERYAQQEDKYDTRYENFTNEGGVPERFRPIGDMTMEMPRASTTFSTSKSTFGMSKADGVSSTSNDIFGMTKASGVSVGNSSSMRSGTMSLGLGGGSSSGGSGVILQYILILIGFPAIAYFVLRRKPSIEKQAPPPKAE